MLSQGLQELQSYREAHPNSVFDYDIGARTYYLEEKYAEAETLWRKALAITLEIFGEDHRTSQHFITREWPAPSTPRRSTPRPRDALAQGSGDHAQDLPGSDSRAIAWVTTTAWQ